MYEVWLEKSAEKDLRNLPPQIFTKIIRKIKLLVKNPKPAGCRKITGSKNDWRIRIGVYRIIYEIDEKNTAVRVMRVKHRKDAYR